MAYRNRRSWAANVTAFGTVNPGSVIPSQAPTPFSTGGDRMIEAGTKVWPVKGKELHKLWSGSPVTMTKHMKALAFHGIPANNKFSRFLELNKLGKQLYLITMFPTPKRDPNDADGVMIFGFVVDLNRTKPISAIEPSDYGFVTIPRRCPQKRTHCNDSSCSLPLALPLGYI